MGTQKHTPGPWKLHKTTTRGEFCWDYKIKSADDSAICTIGPNAQDANAALIAAAPELLEALRKCEATITARYHARGINSYDHDAREAARAAIARAEGR